MTRGHWKTVKMVVSIKNFKLFEVFLKSLDGEFIFEKSVKKGSFILCRVKIPAENKEALLDSQARFL